MTWNRTAVLAALPVGAVAVIAGVVSYSHITALGLRTGQSPADAHLLPLAVDGMVAAGAVILAAGSWLGWLGVVPGVGATLFANLESGMPGGHLAATVAAWPAIAFTVASFMLERWLKSQAGRGHLLRHTGAAYGPEERCMPQPDAAADGQGDTPLATCGHELAGPAEQVVVAAYLHQRDCLGQVPSQRQLAASYGVSRHQVAALVGSLNGHHAQDP